MTRMADQETHTTPEPLFSTADVLSFPPRPLPVGSSGEEVFSRLYVRWFDPLVQYAADSLSVDDAEDVVQQAFQELWERYLGKDLEPDTPYEAVLFAAVRFRIFDYRRTRRRRRSLLEKYAYVGELLGVARRWMRPDARQETRELARILAAAIETLPPRMRELQVLRRRSGLEVPAIARITGTTQSCVREMLGRGNRIIREHMDRAGHSPVVRRALGKEGERR